MVVRIGSNIESLKAQRNLASASDSLSRTLTRLSSGQRINTASDDAAGLAISESLKTDARIFSQGVRNLNDGISLLNIAEGAIRSLTDVSIRIRELATQSANGTFSRNQRQSLQAEVNALVNEHNRITASSTFNGRTLLDGSLTNLTLQAGTGSNSILTTSVGSGIRRTVGDGTFAEGYSLGGSGATWHSTAVGDFNGDGIDDIVSYDDGGAIKVQLFDQNGISSEISNVMSTTAGSMQSIIVTDLNGDNIDDLIVADRSGDVIRSALGNGNGTFQSSFVLAAGNGPHGVSSGDFNRDGITDIAWVNTDTAGLVVATGRGNGSFNAGMTVSNFNLLSPYDIVVQDFNGDGIQDIAASGSGYIEVLVGSGSGSFTSVGTFATGSFAVDLRVADLNNDGYMDLVTHGGGSNSIDVHMGNGNGTFQNRRSYSVSTASGFDLRDMNGDGILDVLTANSTTVGLMLGNSDGSFRSATNVSTGYAGLSDIITGDFNSDGAIDIVVNDNGGSKRFLLTANTTTTTTMQRLSVANATSARDTMDLMDSALARLATEKGNIGSSLSRLGIAIQNLFVARENYLAAASRITDADIASESAELTRSKIVQQVATSVLAQANIQPQIALKLLKN